MVVAPCALLLSKSHHSVTAQTPTIPTQLAPLLSILPLLPLAASAWHHPYSYYTYPSLPLCSTKSKSIGLYLHHHDQTGTQGFNNTRARGFSNAGPTLQTPFLCHQHPACAAQASLRMHAGLCRVVLSPNPHVHPSRTQPSPVDLIQCRLLSCSNEPL